jgi:hypothetical protein
LTHSGERREVIKNMEFFRLSVATLFHPIESFRIIKLNRDKYSKSTISILLLLIVVIRVLCIYVTHYPVAILEARDANIGAEIVKMIGPIFTWIIACYAVTSIMEGEALLREILMASVFSMMPYIILAFPIALLSHLLCAYEIGFFYSLQGLMWVWIAVLVFINVKVINDYSFGRTLGVCIISIFAVILIWGLLLLLYSMTNQLWNFLEGIIREVRFQIGN